jgi:acetate kinase
MGTRSGDIDPAIVFHLNRVAGLSVDELDDLLNRRSGVLGLSGHSDMREVIDAAASGDPRATLALEVYLHRIRHYIGAYAAVLGGLDALVFTAGVGENSDAVRAGAVRGLEFLGITIDPDANAARSREPRSISPAGSPVAVLVIPTDEELEIARQTSRLVG